MNYTARIGQILDSGFDLVKSLIVTSLKNLKLGFSADLLSQSMPSRPKYHKC